MNNKQNDLNSGKTEEELKAMDTHNVFVNHSGDYKKSRLSQVHNACELLFVEQGRADYRINGEVYSVKRHTVLIIGRHDHHDFSFTEVPYIRYGLTVMPDFLRSFPIINQYMHVYRTQNAENFRKLCEIDERTFQRMIEILCALRQETEKGSRGLGEMIYALLLELTLLLKELLQIEKETIRDTDEIILRIKSYIDLHYNQDLSLSELSKVFYLQPNTISKNFSRLVGKNVNAYINAVRITNAAYLLEHTEMNITELAEYVGYASVNTFLRQFRERMDVSPLQYRKRYKDFHREHDTRKLR